MKTMSQQSTPTGAAQRAQDEKKRATRRNARRDFGLRVAFIVLLIALWQGAHWWNVERTGDKSRGALFPSPSQVGYALADGVVVVTRHE